MKHMIPLLMLAAFAAPAAWAGDSAEESSARISARLDEAIAQAHRASAWAQAGSSAGVVVTPRALYFVDGAEVPLEWVEWAEPVKARRVRRAAHTDTVIRIRPGVTLSLANLSGDIRVSTWNRNDVRIQAEHDRSDQLVTQLRGSILKLGVGSRRASPADVEWTLTVPAWLPLELSGIESEIEVRGLRSSVRAQSMRGDVIVVGCRGPVEANSIEGEVHVTDVSGNVSAGSVNNIVRLLRVVGPVEAQTINGDIQMEKLESVDVDASTVNGRVYYASGYQPRGLYVFSSHNGKLFVPTPTDQSVNVTLSSYQGQVESSIPMPAPRAHGKGRSMRFVMRDGVADLPDAPAAPRAPQPPRTPRMRRAPIVPELELESFGGLIRLASQEEVLRALTIQRSRLDSARSMRLRARAELEAARRYARRQAAPAPTRAPAPESPPPQD